MWWYTIGMEGSGNTAEETAGPLVQQALRALMDDDEKQGQDTISIIGSKDDDGNLDEDGSAVQARDTPDEKLVVQSAFVDEGFWDFGSVTLSPENPDNQYYIVSFGSNIMVQTAALTILQLATEARMTPRRFWRMAQALGGGGGYSVLDGIDYGKMSELTAIWEQDPSVTPGMESEDVINLEGLGDMEKIKRAIVHQGCFWVWMRPDRQATFVFTVIF